LMFPPDRMIAHNLSPRSPSGTELSAYMEREWNSSTAYLGDKGEGDGRRKADTRPVGLLTKVVRSARTRVKIPFM
jgi:hypothetical protein